jgi:hypothetical protein
MSHTNAPDELDVSGSPLSDPDELLLESVSPELEGSPVDGPPVEGSPVDVLDESSLEPLLLDVESDSDDVDSVACVMPVDDSDPVEADPVLVSAPPGPES